MQVRGKKFYKKYLTKNSIKLLSEHLKIVVEPGGAVAATAALTKKIDLKNKTVVVMISGGNIDLDKFSSL